MKSINPIFEVKSGFLWHNDDKLSTIWNILFTLTKQFSFFSIPSHNNWYLMVPVYDVWLEFNNFGIDQNPQYLSMSQYLAVWPARRGRGPSGPSSRWPCRPGTRRRRGCGAPGPRSPPCSSARSCSRASPWCPRPSCRGCGRGPLQPQYCYSFFTIQKSSLTKCQRRFILVTWYALGNFWKMENFGK